MRCTNENLIEVNEVYYRVPCGKCLACLSNKRADWSFRLEQEHKGAIGSAFITLTYHPMFVPDAGVTKRHVQLYMKRLRKRIGKKIRYYAVGEYGTNHHRPHYHILIFNYDSLSDEKFIRQAWTYKREPIGIVHVGQVTVASIRYCTKYVIQGRASVPEGYTNEPFSLMSRAYGLGASYLTEAMMRWHRGGSESITKAQPENCRNYTYIYGEKGRLPRYYRSKLWPTGSPYGNYQWLGKNISRISSDAGKEAEKVNRENLKQMGYDPDKIMTEMREAVMNRIKEKIAYTQKF